MRKPSSGLDADPDDSERRSTDPSDPFLPDDPFSVFPARPPTRETVEGIRRHAAAREAAGDPPLPKAIQDLIREWLDD